MEWHSQEAEYGVVAGAPIDLRKSQYPQDYGYVIDNLTRYTMFFTDSHGDNADKLNNRKTVRSARVQILMPFS